MSLDFFDRDRIPIAYTDDDEHLYSFCGRPVAYIHEGSIYSYPGHHLGCISDGVIRDNHGHIVLYTADSRGGCVKPYLLPASWPRYASVITATCAFASRVNEVREVWLL